MKEQYLSLLKCISCNGTNLSIKPESIENGIVISGRITCACGKSYPIKNSIPRFIDNWDSLYDTKKKFEFQWKTWGKEDVIFGRTKEESKKYLLETAGFDIEESYFKNKIVLDGGCGHGRFVQLFAEMGSELSVGIDLGSGIEIAAMRNNDLPNTFLVQGNLLNPPFRSEIFDYIWCNGVIHHTPDPKLGAKNLFESTKKGGYINLWLYPKGSLVWEVSQKFIRSITTKLPPPILRALCYLAVPLLYIAPTYSGTNPRKNTWKHCAQVIYDWYSPKYQSHHTNKEVIRWFHEFGCETYDLKDPATTVIGKK